MMVSTCVGAIALVSMLGGSGTHAHATSFRQPSSAPSPKERRLAAYDEALTALKQELAYIVLLGWGEQPLPPIARELPAAIGVERSAASKMIDEVRFLDGQAGPLALAGLEALGEPVTPAVEAVLSRNLPLDVGGTPQVDTAVYLKAYEQLLGPWSDLKGVPVPTLSSPGTTVDVVAPQSVVPESVAPAKTATTTPTAEPDVPATAVGSVDATVASPAAVTVEGVVAGEVRTDSTGSGATGGLVIVIVVAAFAGLGVVLALTRRRRDSSHGSQAIADDVLDAGRTIMAAVELDEFLRSVAEQVSRLVGADGAVVVEGQSWTPPGRDLPSEGVLDRVLTTGRSVRADDAVVVPIVADGRVVGALVSWSRQPQPEETLGAFAPLVGAALQGVRSRLVHEHLAFDDGLTGVGNRRRFDRDLDRFIGPDSDRRVPVALAMVDVDHFKRFNDTHGHQTGDAVLRHVAAVIAAQVRTGDLVYRYGGEEFAVLLPDADLSDAIEIVERVRLAIAATPLPGEAYASVPAVTVSVGVSATPPVDGDAMVRSADQALYVAKSAGRNRVEAMTAS